MTTQQNQGGQQPARVALESIGRAIAELSRPTGTSVSSDYLGNTHQVHTYPVETGLEKLLVTEDLIGAAFVLAQTHIGSRTGTKLDEVRVVANYWKHRDGWDAQWTVTNSNKPTVPALALLGFTAPTVSGQLTQIAEKVLGGPFDVNTLWQIIA